MNEQQPLSYFFTHIPKTAGTSVRKLLLYPNIAECQTGRARGVREVMRRDWSGYRWLEGHYPYGVHRFMRGLRAPPVYFTMLRDPVERAVSYYYFLRAAKSDTYEHPEHHVAVENSIASFYALPDYQNVQTRFLAGVLWHRLRNYAAMRIADGLMLRVAKRNLAKKYWCFGLTERHDASIRLFARTFGWSCTLPEQRVKATTGRPSVEELPQRDLDAVRAANRLDHQLYQYAKARFDRQFTKARP